jgi:Bacterial SH3 domain
MGQLMLSPSANVLSIRDPRVKRTAAKITRAHLPGTLQPPLPLTPQRLALIKTLAKEMSRSPSERIADPPRPQDLGRDNQQGKTPRPSQVLLVLPRKFWILLAALIFIALLPNLILAPIFWLRLFDKPIASSSPVPANRGPTADHVAMSANRSSIDNPSTVATPVLSAPSIVEVTVGKDINFPLAIDGTDGMPASSKVVVKGLPPGSKLSNGRPVGDSEWSLKPNEIGDLRLMLRDNVITASKVTIQLVTPDGHVLADTATIIKGAIEAGLLTGTAAQPMENQTRQLELMLAEKPMMPAASTAELEEEEKPMMPEAATADAAPLSAQNPEAENNDGNTKWVETSAFVNLRKGPSSSASIISVVERGTKLRALARKKGWIQVSNPATLEKGWIYAGNIQN